MLTEIFLVITALLTVIYFKLTSEYGYWKKRGVKYIKPAFIFGNIWDLLLFRKTRPQFNIEVYNAGAGEPYIGIILTREPALYIRGPEMIRQILTKDFAHFNNRGIAFNEKRDPLSAHLFILEGARWRNLRTKLTPTFTSGKMKHMLPFMQECAEEMVRLLQSHADGEVIEMRDILARYTTDIIGTCAFGVQCNSLRDPDAEFRRMGALILAPNKFGITRHVITSAFPKLAGYVPMTDTWKKGTTYFLRAIQDTVRYREQNNVQRRDFLDLLLQIKKKGTIVGNPEELKNDAFVKNMGDMKIEDFEFTDNMVAAQAFIFFLAGFETSSTALSYTLIELSRNPEIQRKLRKEVDTIYEKNGNKFTYESLMVEMTYLDKVISESMRMYPPVPVLVRKVSERYKVPDTGLVMDKGLRLIIPVYAIHHDPEIYPDPEKFDPERFSEEAKAARHNYTYLPFGEGPRNCIGQRFGLLQTKLGLAMLIRNFEFELGPEMPYPPIISKTAVMILSTEHGTYLRIRRRP